MQRVGLRLKGIIPGLLLLFSTCSLAPVMAQYAPAAGKPGSSALYKDSSIFIHWAKSCTLRRGWRHIGYKDSGYVSVGDSNSATGKAGENGVVSLGDSGEIICRFEAPVVNGSGWDFAVFENTFDDRYLELAFVEVSSDGRRFFRFPCHSLTDTVLQTGPFGYTEPEHINHLAGKYRAQYGTPFDLDALPDYKDLNKNSITHIKILDVVGSLIPQYATKDSAGRTINDPWPTPFSSGGFDLDAIGVIHSQVQNSRHPEISVNLISGPNPITDRQQLLWNTNKEQLRQVILFNAQGTRTESFEFPDIPEYIEGDKLPQGPFWILVVTNQTVYHYKGIKL